MKQDKEFEKIGNQILSHKGNGYDQVLLSQLEGEQRAFSIYLLSAQREEYTRQNATARNVDERLRTVQKDDFVEFGKLPKSAE